MAIKINDIPPEGLTLELAEKVDLFDQGSATTAFTAAISIKPAGKRIFRVIGNVRSAAELECSRCLKHFPYRIESELDFDLIPEGAQEMPAEHELGGSELNTEFYRGDEIEPLDFVKEQMLLSLPMVPLHDPDCKGLCPVCGADLNAADCGCKRDFREETSAFTKLKDMFKK